MKKLFVVLGLLCGIVGNSWGVCELSESTDRTPSDEDLYPQNPNDNRMALICQKGKCEEDEIVYMDVVPHYIGNVFYSEGFTTVNDKAYYRCKIGGNDKWKTATSADLSVSDERQDLIVFSDSKQMFIYGKKSSDGNYYTNVHYVKPDEKCGVKCTPENVGGYVYCDNNLWFCRYDDLSYEFVAANRAPFGFCTYSNPQTRTDTYKVENEWTKYAGWSLWGAATLRPGDDVDENMSFCMGCKSGFFSDGNDGCYNNLGQAWCEWRKNKDSKNTEWKDDKCNCLDSGVEWNTDQHDCVKTKKGGGKTTGKTGGKTGGNAGGSTGSGKADEKCGVKCNKEKEYEFFYCNNDIIHCVPDLSGGYEFDENSSFFFNVCEYSDPVNFVAEHAQRYEMVEVSFYSGDGYNGNMDLMGPAGLKNGDKVSLSDPFCRVCKPGTYKDFYIDNCYKNENEAWCKWRKDKDKLNTDWQNGECKCLDAGMKWDTTIHNCIADGKGDSKDKKDKKITVAKCEINIAADVKCRQNTAFSGTVELDLSPEICEKYKAKPSENLYEIARLLCADWGGVDTVLSDADIQDAQKRIDKFLQYSESNTSVWKNAEGKFNTARLASDATAGVILGTVGGIVSAKIIKKKQVEKGFDALKCTISGQKVADWGDEFRVGLGR